MTARCVVARRCCRRIKSRHEQKAASECQRDDKLYPLRHRTSPFIMFNFYLVCPGQGGWRNLAKKKSRREMLIGRGAPRSAYRRGGLTAATAATTRQIESVCDPRATAFAAGNR